MSYPCANCNRDEGSPVCLRDARCLGHDLGPVKINNQTYTRPVIRVAMITMDGGASCGVLVGDLFGCIEDGHEYTVQVKTIPLREFEAMPEFNGW